MSDTGNTVQSVPTVLYVRLPVWKIWPGGVVYLADFIHKQRPDVRQEILDLALVPPGRRRAALSERIAALQPDVVAFSWRNMQTFGPHPENDALDVVMNYDHSPSPWRRAKATDTGTTRSACDAPAAGARPGSRAFTPDAPPSAIV